MTENKKTEKKRRRFTVHIQIDLWTEKEILADSFEDALTQARDLSIHDLIKIRGGHHDSNIRVTGVFE